MIIPRSRYDNLNYKPSKFTIAFYLWFSTFIKEDNKPAIAHFMMIDHIFTKHRHKVVEASRGLSKTSLVAVYLLLYFIFLGGRKPNFGEFKYVLLISDTVGQVRDILEHIITVLEENEGLSKHIEVIRKRLDDDPIIIFKTRGKRVYVRGKGSGQKLRGRKAGGGRPDIVIVDDLENEEIVDNPDTLAKLKKWFFGSVLPSVNPNKYEIIFIGTPLHQNSLLVNLLYSDEWKAIQLPACEEFPVDSRKFVSAWKDRFTYDYIMKMYDTYKSSGEELTFYQEYMLEVSPREGLLFDINNLKEFDWYELEKRFSNFTFYVSVDLAVSEKRTADYTSIAVIGIYENNWFLVDGFFGRIKPDETIRYIFNFAYIYKPEAVVVEKVGFQASMKTFIENEMVKKGFFFNLEMIPRTKSKLSVIKSLQPIISFGRLWIPNNRIKSFVAEFRKELMGITHSSILSKHDDVVDSIAQLTQIDLTNAPARYESRGNKDVEAYLNGNETMNNPYIF